MPTETLGPERERWSLATHVPQEMIAAIFSWIHPGEVKKFRSICRLVDQVLSDPFFHNLNLRNFYRRLNPTEDVVCIRYSVFPHLDKVSASWEIVDYGQGQTKLTFRSGTIGIMPAASRMAKKLKLPIDLDNLNARTLLRYQQGHIRSMNAKDLDRRGPQNYDPSSEVLIFWPPQAIERSRQETVPVFVPGFRPICQSVTYRDPTPTRVKIWFTVHPCDKYSWYSWRDVYCRSDSKVNIIKNLLDVLLDFMRDHCLANLIVRRIPLDQSDLDTAPTSIFKCASNGAFIPFDPDTERLHLTPVGFNESPSPEIQTQWDQLLQKGEEAAKESQWSTAIEAFRLLVTAKKDVYGFKDPRAYENYVDIAAVYLTQGLYREASGTLCAYFENGPQGGTRGGELVFEKATKIMESLAELGNCDGIKTFDLVQSDQNIKLRNELRPIFFKTGLFCGRIAVRVLRETDINIGLDEVNSLHVSGKYLYEQGRFQEALWKFKVCEARRMSLLEIENQQVELQETKDMIRATLKHLGRI
ncbi:hypothetical protein BDR26DRAFT_859209 [Obelidium mucronatum]|nr:hypothetical protein BDR26DRAFT_859209 [Obelidium mucronatum]